MLGTAHVNKICLSVHIQLDDNAVKDTFELGFLERHNFSKDFQQTLCSDNRAGDRKKLEFAGYARICSCKREMNAHAESAGIKFDPDEFRILAPKYNFYQF